MTGIGIPRRRSSTRNRPCERNRTSRRLTNSVAKPERHGMVATMPGKTSKPQDQSTEAPHYHGHRERLRERFFNAGPDALSDYELLELALFAAIPRRDTKPLAKELLQKFGSFTEVIHAPVTRLREVKGIKDASINQLKLLAAASGRAAKREIERKVALSSWNDVIDYCRSGMAFSDKEQFRLLFLDKRNQLISDEIQHTGTVEPP